MENLCCYLVADVFEVRLVEIYNQRLKRELRPIVISKILERAGILGDCVFNPLLYLIALIFLLRSEDV